MNEEAKDLFLPPKEVEEKTVKPKSKNKIVIIITALIIASGVTYYLVSNIGRYGNEIVWAVDRLPTSLNPVLPGSREALYMADLIFDGLVNIDSRAGKITFQYALANSIQQQSDKKTYLIKLRKMRWHDDRPVTTDDVLFSVKSIRFSRNRSPLKGRMDSFIEKVQKIDELTLKVIFYRPVPSYIAKEILTFKIIPHLYNGAALNEDMFYGDREREFARAPIGTGSFKFVSWDINKEITLERNTKAVIKVPQVDRFRAVVVHGHDKKISKLLKKKINLVVGVESKRLDSLKAKGCDCIQIAPYAFYTLAFNCRIPFLKDKRVRQAIVLAINRLDVVKQVAPGLKADEYINLGPFPHNSNFPNLPDLMRYNPQQAKTLLATYGKRIKLTIYYTTAGGDIDQNTAKTIAEMLKKAGIEASIHGLGENVFQSKVFAEHDFQTALVKWQGFSKLYNVVPLYQSNSPLNIMGINDEILDEELFRWEMTVEMGTKRSLSRNIHRRLLDLSPCVFLYTLPEIMCFTSDLQGVEPVSGAVLATAGNWFVSH